jgi:hypothetical protein
MVRETLNQYCVTCHNQKLRTGGLALDLVDVTDMRQAAVWEGVVRKVRAGAMPPAGRPQPDRRDANELVAWLETSLDRAAAAHPNPGRPTVGRLNRTEYRNAVRDLLDLDIGSVMLPPDDAAFGFDNNADILTISPGLLERYMMVARRISRLAVGDPALKPSTETYDVSESQLQDDRVSEDLPFGSRGGIAVRHYFPVDAEYTFKVHLGRRRGGAGQIDVRLDGERIKLLAIGGRGRGARPPDEAGGGNAANNLEVTIPVKAGSHQVGVTFAQNTLAPEGLAPTHLPVGNIAYAGKQGAEVVLDRIDITGPLNATGSGDAPSRRRIFVCRPGARQTETACAKEILQTLARRAYRRPTTDADVRKLMAIYEPAAAERGFESGIQFALQRVLVDPEFLFRVERDPANLPTSGVYRLSDVEMASRLSFFLWSSIPDDELLDAAIRGRLKNPATLEAQIRRMLADPRASALMTSFASQWLYLRNLPTHAPDVNAFPGFDDDLRRAMVQETELFLDSQLRDDRGVPDLLTANYTFVNERLARHYGIPNVYGSHFRRVSVDESQRGGLLGHGSILTVTSYANRTSPVLRGKWLLENILGTPPPPPPPDVPDLPDAVDHGTPRSIRERMELHRKNPACAGCHARMDPLGFALENFDAIGRWRSIDESKNRVDASGVLPDGTRFDGPRELRRLLAVDQQRFVTTVVEKLLTYALRRGLEPTDMPAVRTVVRKAAEREHRWSAIVMEIVKSTPFQMKRSST